MNQPEGVVSAGRWQVETKRDSAAALHGLAMPEPVKPAVWVLEATAPAVVLGSSQRIDLVDPEAACALGFDVAKRRSGGGAVLVVPQQMLWLDVLLPAGDPLWTDDVGRAFLWLGQVWATALETLGTATHMHTGGLQRTPVSDLVCFAGRGPGELLANNAKVVGLSQRRTRAGARFQCAAVLQWDPTPFADLLGLGQAVMDEVMPQGAGLELPAEQVLQAFLNQLAKT